MKATITIARQAAAAPKRFHPLSIPAGDSAFWYVRDRETGKTYECDDMQAARETAKLSNEFGALV